MRIARLSIALLLGGSAARSQEIQPLLERPPTLRRGGFELTLNGTYANWASGGGAETAGSIGGETVALGADFGATDGLHSGWQPRFPSIRGPDSAPSSAASRSRWSGTSPCASTQD